MTAPPTRHMTAALLLGLLVAIPCALQAWVTDDAFITLRVVDNVLSGRGAVWNAGQRVQVYTHPAWFALLVAVVGVTREFFLTPMVLGVTLTFGFVVGLTWRAPLGRALFVASLLAASPSFVDFATSGLENPLTHVWLLLAALEASRREVRVARLALFGGLLQLTRPDGVLLMAPLVALHVVRAVGQRGLWPTARGLLLASLPLLAWYAFALVYYGTPIANTALAKLGAGLPPRHTWPVGLHYLSTLTRDPAALVLIVAAAWTALRAWRARDTQPGASTALAWWAGIALHTTYVVSVGGDFMLGRFWTPWIALSAVLVVVHGGAATAVCVTPAAAAPRLRRRWVRPLLATAAALAAHAAVFNAGPHPWVPEASAGAVSEDLYGVSDERSFYREHLSIQAWQQGRGPATLPSATYIRQRRVRADATGARVVLEGSQAGVMGFVSGPNVHLLDAFALADPLLSRLPTFRMPRFRAGHLPRVVPPGYVASEREGEDRFEDPALGALWRRVSLLTRGPLFTRERWDAIFWFATHDSTEGLDEERYLLWHATRATPAQLAETPAAVRDMGIHVDLGRVMQAEHVTVQLSPPDRRELWFYRGDERLVELVAPASNAPVPVPDEARGGFDRVVVLPRDFYRPEARTLDGFELDGRVPQPSPPPAR